MHWVWVQKRKMFKKKIITVDIMMDNSHFKKLENMYLQAPINHFYHSTIQIAKGKAEIIVTIKPAFFHAAQAVHGSVYFKSLDDAAFFAANSLVKDVFVLTVNFNLYFTRPVTEGEMVASGRVVHHSRQLFVAESALTDSKGREIARGSGSFMKSNIPLTPEIGYK